MAAVEYKEEYLGERKIGEFTVKRYRVIRPEEEVAADIAAIQKFLAGVNKRIIEEYKLTDKEIAWKRKKQEEAYELLGAGKREEADKIYAEIKQMLAEKKKKLEAV